MKKNQDGLNMLLSQNPEKKLYKTYIVADRRCTVPGSSQKFGTDVGKFYCQFKFKQVRPLGKL